MDTGALDSSPALQTAGTGKSRNREGKSNAWNVKAPFAIRERSDFMKLRRAVALLSTLSCLLILGALAPLAHGFGIAKWEAGTCEGS
jgi:hypothetical protein